MVDWLRPILRLIKWRLLPKGRPPQKGLCFLLKNGNQSYFFSLPFLKSSNYLSAEYTVVQLYMLAGKFPLQDFNKYGQKKLLKMY